MSVYPESMIGKQIKKDAGQWLIVKLDIYILSFCCLLYWINYLDCMSLNNAYVSGTEQDLGFTGNQLNVINTIFYGGYELGQVPNNLALQKLAPRIYFPSCMIAGVSSPWVPDSPTFQSRSWSSDFFKPCLRFVGSHYILGSWYKEDEVAKRTALFTSSGLVGTRFSGFLQNGIHESLDGKHGGILGWSLISRVLRTWHWVGFSLIWVFASNTEMFSTNAIMNLWLSSTDDYSVSQVNYIPTAVAGVGIVATLGGWYSDFTKRQWHVGIMLALTATISGRSSWDSLAMMNMFVIAVYMFWSLLFYSTTQGPEWTEGSIAMICMEAAFVVVTIVVWYLEKQDKQRVEVFYGSEQGNEKEGSVARDKEGLHEA
ncbi:hypothetical protein BDV12DRAFT_185524 [Aspergillus spectabilis]